MQKKGCKGLKSFINVTQSYYSTQMKSRAELSGNNQKPVIHILDSDLLSSIRECHDSKTRTQTTNQRTVVPSPIRQHQMTHAMFLPFRIPFTHISCSIFVFIRSCFNYTWIYYCKKDIKCVVLEGQSENESPVRK